MLSVRNLIILCVFTISCSIVSATEPLPSDENAVLPVEEITLVSSVGKIQVFCRNSRYS